MVPIASTDDAEQSEMLDRLQGLLDRASSLKPTQAIEPPLPVLEFAGDKGLPLVEPDTPSSHKLLVDVASKRILHTVAANTSIEDPSFAQVWNLFDILSICSDQEQCDPALLWLLIEELLDYQSIAGCRIAFDYLESRRERLTAKHFKSKHLVILRLCNELLRRLSRAEDTVFCGRVCIFLFSSFPLGDKSSVNLRGEFHVENVTTFEETAPEDGPRAAGEDSVMTDAVTITVTGGDGKPKEEDEKREMTIDQLYPIFWTLQKDFSNPPLAFEPETLAGFKMGLEASIAMFKKMPKVISAAATGENRGVKRKAGEMPDDFSSTYNPKYLTSRELFNLEVRVQFYTCQRYSC
jgi:THO complex subunit 1